MWESVGTGLIRLCLLIDSFIYGIVSKLFSLFVELANYSSMFFSKSVISSFTGRIYILVGVIALFIIVYSLLMSIANPDDAIKGKNSGPKIIMNLVTSIVLIALVPSIFNFAYAAQEAILGDDIIGRIFLGTTTHDVNTNEGFIYNESAGEAYKIESNNTPTNLVKQHGNNLAWSVLNAFFYPEDVNGDGTPDDIETKWSNSWGNYRNTSSGIRTVTCWTGIAAIAVNVISIPFSGGATTAGLPYTTGIAAAACGVAIANEGVASIGYELTDEILYWGEMKQRIIADGEFSLMSAFAEKIEADEITYMPIVSTIVGLILLYLIFSFCIDLGLRAVKLAFYQMIAPIPIFMRILPNNKVFGNWTKAVITTFVEVFTRMVILYTIVFLASNISNTNLPGGFFAKMVIIMGIVTFGKQAPKLLAEVTGIDSGNMKLGIMDKMNAATFGFAGGVLGGATGFLGAGIAAKAAGAGFFRGGVLGMANGWKARGNQFGKQKQNLYSSLGGKGKAGLLGKQTLMSRATTKMTSGQMDKMREQVSSKAGARQNLFESGALFNTEKQNAISGDETYNGYLSDIESINAEIDAYNVDSINESIANSEKQMGYYKQTMEYKDFAARQENQASQIYKDHFYDKNLSLSENRDRFNKMLNEGRFDSIIDSRFSKTDGENARKFAEQFNAKLQAEKQLSSEEARLKALKNQKSQLEIKASDHLVENDAKYLKEAREKIKSESYKSSESYRENKKEIEAYINDLSLSKESLKNKENEKKSTEKLIKDLEKLMKDNKK